VKILSSRSAWQGIGSLRSRRSVRCKNLGSDVVHDDQLLGEPVDQHSPFLPVLSLSAMAGIWVGFILYVSQARIAVLLDPGGAFAGSSFALPS
jgi:hypothetical protein